MRYRGKSQSGQGVTTYDFSIGASELIILRDILNHLHVVTPKTFFNIPFTSRFESMRQTINKLIVTENINTSYIRTKGYDTTAPQEVL